MSNTAREYDILIAGGGMVGATLAAALGESDYRVALVEAFPISSDKQASYDERSVALSYGSKQILAQMGLWDTLSNHAEKINTIHISDRGYFGATRLHAKEEGVEALGYVITNRCIGQVLMQHIATLDNVTLFCPASVTQLERQNDRVQLTVELQNQQSTLTTKLLIAADGANSSLRKQLGITESVLDYQQTAVVCNITPSLHHNNIAYERFTDEGPLAFLPLQSEDKTARCTIVWTMPSVRADQIMQLADEEFLHALQHRFGQRLGKLTVAGSRKCFPLMLTQSDSVIAERAVLLGNAAQALHPVAGQGFNLALRDAGILAESLLANTLDPGSADLLQTYSAKRRPDQLRSISFTDQLVKIFSNKVFPFAHTRSLGLLAVDLLPIVKHRFARYTMGLESPLPRISAKARKSA